MRVVSKDARGAGVAARRATAASGPIAHLAPQEPVAVVAEATFVGAAQRLQGLPAATLGRHGPGCRRSSEVPLVSKQALESAAPLTSARFRFRGVHSAVHSNTASGRRDAPLPVPGRISSAPAYPEGRALQGPSNRRTSEAQSPLVVGSGIRSIEEDVKKLESPPHCRRDPKRWQLLWKSIRHFFGKVRVTIGPSDSPTYTIHPREINMRPYKNSLNVHNSITQNSPKV